MSYCRWSASDPRCDLYCYESEEGWTTHVAAAGHGLPFDGMSFVDGEPASFRDRLLSLRAAGYVFPDHVLESAADDMEEKPTDATASTKR